MDDILAKAKQKALELMGKVKGSGMGDVRASDSSYTLPTLSQGFGNPERDAIAQSLRERNKIVAQINPLAAQNVTPEDVDRFERAASVGSFSGGLKQVAGLPAHALAKGEEFAQALGKAMEERPQIKEFITKYAPEEYKGMRTFLSPDKKSGYAIKPDGELVSVFSSAKGRGDQITKEAVEQGASKLDAFDVNQKLPELYGKHGFKEFKREPNWTPGGPDVTYMARPEVHPNLFSSNKLGKVELKPNPGDYTEKMLSEIPRTEENMPILKEMLKKYYGRTKVE